MELIMEQFPIVIHSLNVGVFTDAEAAFLQRFLELFRWDWLLHLDQCHILNR